MERDSWTSGSDGKESHPTADAKIADPGGDVAGPSADLENLPVLWSMLCI